MLCESAEEVELRNLSSADERGPSNSSEEIFEDKTKKESIKKGISFKAVGKTVISFFGIPERNFDKDRPKNEENQRKELWRNRRLRLATRAYGGLKEDVLQQGDEVDDPFRQSLPSSVIARTKPSVWAYAKDGITHFSHNWRKITPSNLEQKSRSFHPSSLYAESETVDGQDASTEINFFDDRKPDEVDHRIRAEFNGPTEVVGVDRIGRIALQDLTEELDRRRYGDGLVGQLLHRRFKESVRQQPVVKQQLDDFEDYRPYFTYWITTVQTLIVILSLAWYGFAPLGIELSLTSDFVLTEKLIYEQVAFYQPSSFWLGPRAADLIHLGAKFSPCMRLDMGIVEGIEKRRRDEAQQSGCCIRNDNSGCLQTTKEKCSTVLSTFHKWDAGRPGPDGRVSGPVCGQDPRYCRTPLSVPPNMWPDDISQWPVCNLQSETPVGAPEHMVCETTARPCCVGIHGRCEMRNREYCDFVHGHFHPEATLCSQVSCMQDVCGMLPFLGETPDQVYRLWTSLFLHAGIIHLAITVAVQLYLMRDLERLCGPLRLSIIYLGSGIIGNLASAIFVPFRAESGPAGAQFGLLAALIIEVVNAWPMLRSPWQALLKLLAVLTVLLLCGFLPWVDNYAHVFGFISGLLLSLIFLPYVNFNQSGFFYTRAGRIAVVVGCLLSLTAIFVSLLVIFYALPEASCDSCRFFSCIPFTNKFCAEQNIDFAVREDYLSF